MTIWVAETGLYWSMAIAFVRVSSAVSGPDGGKGVHGVDALAGNGLEP
jgi:hypothetical protein